MFQRIAIATVCVLFAARCAHGEELTAEKIRSLAAQKDDRSKVLEALKVYPAAIEYSLSVRVGVPGQQMKESPKVMAREALVEGKYLVTQFRPPAYKADLITVVYFDDAQDCYRSATLLPDGSLGTAVGTRRNDSRVISWVSVSKPDEKEQGFTLAQDVLSDTDRRWREITMEDGKVVSILECVATVTKKPQ